MKRQDCKLTTLYPTDSVGVQRVKSDVLLLVRKENNYCYADYTLQRLRILLDHLLISQGWRAHSGVS